MTVPNVQQYTPLGVQAFGLLDPNGLNTLFALIATTFTAQSALPTATANTQLGVGAQNLQCSLAGAAANHTMVVTLPQNPAVGDPSCIVSLLQTGVSVPANAIVTTADGNTINGILPNAGNTNVPALYIAGDTYTFTFVGGPVGWLAFAQLSAVPIAAPLPAGALPWQGQTAVMTTAVPLSVEALQWTGARAMIINRAAGLVPVGDATSTFNGVAGPFNVAQNVQATFVSLGNRAFTVTT